jgi:hypothetical protein
MNKNTFGGILKDRLQERKSGGKRYWVGIQPKHSDLSDLGHEGTYLNENVSLSRQ